TGIVNFAQGEMGMFSTFIAWSLIENHGMEYWLGFTLVPLISLAAGAGIYGAVIRPLQRGGELAIVIATIALLILLNGLAGWILDPPAQTFHSPVPQPHFPLAGGV